MVRGKFIVDSIATTRCNPNLRVVKFVAQYDDGVPENQRYATATPSGSIEMTIDNPAAADQFVLGGAFYVDFTPAP